MMKQSKLLTGEMACTMPGNTPIEVRPSGGEMPAAAVVIG
jgi:hypothetical protein